MIATIMTVSGSVMTFLGTFAIAKMKMNLDRQKFYEDKISEILDVQSKEIKGLKEEIEKLVQENRWLRLELERGNRHYEEKTPYSHYSATK